MKTAQLDALVRQAWRLPLCAGLVLLVGIVLAGESNGQDPVPQQINMDGPFRLPLPPYALDPSVPAEFLPTQTAPAAPPVQQVNGPLFAPFVPAPSGPIQSPYQNLPSQPSPFQPAPFQPAPAPPYAAPQFNAPQNGVPQYPPQYQPLPNPPLDYQPGFQQPGNQQPVAPQLPAPAPETPSSTPPPEVVPPPPPAEKSTAPLLVEESGWGWWTPKMLDPWEGNVELGMNGTDGNSQTFNIRFGVTAKHKTETFVQSLQLTSIQKSANGNTTANTALLDGRLEWPMPNSRFNYFIHGLAEYDEFKAFDVRLSGDTGFGYEFIQNDMTTLMGRSGLAFSREIGGPDTTVHPELLFGGEYKHKFSPTHSISMKVDYFPDVTDFSDFRVNSQASWEIALSQAWGMSLKFSVIDRYDSTPQGAKPNDLDYSTLLLWTF
ncbi:hypothetical protein ETAA8_01780 [Anatilimnocola aggregata]|uniref:DUF481 domain-containing protein n=1 Tax=Anatilimnocola aggregata TaxID=2528021 RepID=A0A517Y4H2_9BACT|nr:DUF481 domain-containing protein [Anatilimnocola aggregata]QDU25117.1 hypothetical protein ETAA8_01780 [Anatilimnocola aggregata]